jgi:hypothetical protein
MTTHDHAVAIDAPAFDPWAISAVTHQLCGHPLLQIDALIEVGKRLEARKLVRTHSDEAGAGSSFADAPNLHPNKRSAAETLSGIADAHAWMSLLNVQADPVYRTLVDDAIARIPACASAAAGSSSARRVRSRRSISITNTTSFCRSRAASGCMSGTRSTERWCRNAHWNVSTTSTRAS